MFEKVSMSHPDKIADRIAGAIVDLAYKKEENPKIAVEVLIGHGECNIIIESSVNFNEFELDVLVKRAVERIVGKIISVNIKAVPQDIYLAKNQEKEIRCGDNGIFKGVPLSEEEKRLSRIARTIYDICPSDGKYLLDGNHLIVCQSNATKEKLHKICDGWGYDLTVNPLGEWTGGIDSDCGLTGRKLGSDLARGATSGSITGKDISKADVSVNIYCFLKAQETNKVVTACCAIGDTILDIHVGDSIEKHSFKEVVDVAKKYIDKLGGFEKLAEWGLV